MPTGKAASQAGHAFLDAFLSAPEHIADVYTSDGHGTKIVLVAEDEEAILAAYEVARGLDLPCALVIDSGHVMLPKFDGSPIVTALGIGPALCKHVRRITKGFSLMR